MNETKKLKKFLRNKDNKVIVKIVETDPWGGDRVLTTTLTMVIWREKPCYGNKSSNRTTDAYRDLLWMLPHLSTFSQ